jgi:hypothetical protein
MKTTHHPLPPGCKALDSSLDDLLHPAQAFDHPNVVVGDPDLTLNEKRAILASWASDACAVEAAAALRHPPGARQTLSIDEVLGALRALDQQAHVAAESSWMKRQARRQSFEHFRMRRREQRGFGPEL